MPEFAYSPEFKPKIGYVSQREIARPKKAMILTLPPRQSPQDSFDRKSVAGALISIAIVMLLVALLLPESSKNLTGAFPDLPGIADREAMQTIRAIDATESLTGQIAQVDAFRPENHALMEASPRLTEAQRKRLLTILEHN